MVKPKYSHPLLILKLRPTLKYLKELLQ